jgi:hypothetical protein
MDPQRVDLVTYVTLIGCFGRKEPLRSEGPSRHPERFSRQGLCLAPTIIWFAIVFQGNPRSHAADGSMEGRFGENPAAQPRGN